MTSKTTEASTPSTETSTVEGVASKAAAATFEQLMAKPRRVLNFTIYSTNEDGEEVALQIKYRALSSKEYDDLVAEHPPSTKERQNGAVYNVDTFAPALISAVSQVPKLSLEQAKEIYTSADWSGGEISSLFVNALRVCNSGLDVPFNARD